MLSEGYISTSLQVRVVRRPRCLLIVGNGPRVDDERFSGENTAALSYSVDSRALNGGLRLHAV
jgi:hypothetical protein